MVITGQPRKKKLVTPYLKEEKVRGRTQAKVGDLT
jgi:hypothetical protein